MTTSNYKIQKVNKKQRRCNAIISNECSIASSEEPTRFLAILNAGLSTGLTDEAVLAEASRYGEVQQLVMLPGKSYSFLVCPDIQQAENIFVGMHNHSRIGQSGAIVFLSYFESIPKVANSWETSQPSGLYLFEDFVSEDEERSLLQFINASDDSSSSTDKLKQRQVKHFGYEFLYGINNVNPDCPLEQKIPEDCDALWQRLEQKAHEEGLEMTWTTPDQLTVNVYQPGHGIPQHVDTHSAFLDPILSLSLENDVVMDFRKEEQTFSLVLPRRSLLVMSGESRYAWTHGIASRVTDVVPSKLGTLTTKRRSQRTSLTFRKLRRGPCDCNYPTLCDTRQQSKEGTAQLGSLASKLEEANVHDVYEKIADHFSETRHKPWPRVTEFLGSFECGSVLVDVGCGNGKYLYPIEDILKIGCDRSEGLLRVCVSNKHNVFRCDCLSVPIRSASVDGCFSIAVIHHLASPERRLAAIKEMARVLRTGGRALIYVWAKNQRSDDRKSSYLLQNKAVNKKKVTEEEQRLMTANLSHKTTQSLSLDLPIHTNRTEFQQQDVLVPWKLKTQTQAENQTYLRYYHVFESNELENLVAQIPEIELVESYYDQGNHCVIFKKK